MPEKSLITARGQMRLLGLIGVGALGTVVGLVLDGHRFWPGLLLNACYFLTLALGATVFVSIQHIANAGWSAGLRRVPEAMMSYLPLGAIALLAIFFGRHSLYEWTHPGALPVAHTSHFKAAYLSTPFFFARMTVILALWIAFSYWLRRESLKQDLDGLLEHTQKSKKYSAMFLVVFAITFSLASFDWLMSLEPEFYSTIFAFYCFSGLFLAGIAAITLAIILLRRRGLLTQVTDTHLHNLGKLIVSFSTFWAYIWLSQYLLIYYANLPEETTYYLKRTATPGWKTLFFANIFLNWLVPFTLLLSSKAKRHAGSMAAACVIVLAGHWVDLYTMILPVFGGSALIGPADIALFTMLGSFFLLSFSRSLAGVSLVPMHDPYLVESLSLHSEEAVEPGLAWDRNANRALILSTAGFAITFAIWGMVGALAPKFREMYQLSPMQTSLLIAIPVLLGSIGRLPMGILADKFGGRAIFGSLLIFCLIPAIGVSFTSSYTALLVWAFFIGFAGTSFSVGVAFTSKWFQPDQQGTALGIYGMGNIGQSVAVFGAPALVALTNDWRWPFWICASMTAVFGLVFLCFARNAAARTQPKKLSEYFGVLRREPLAWILSLFYFLTFGGFVALSIYLPTLLKDIFGLRPTDAGARVAGFVVVATLMRPIGGWLADRYGGATVLLLVLSLISVLALGLTSTNMLIFTIGALGTATMLGAGNGAVFKLVPEHFPRETGTVTGLVGAAGGLGGFFPPLVLGVIRTRTGSYTLGFVFLVCFALICLATNYWVFTHRKRRLPETLTASY
jgi:NNP family nitrate/nitrite transporter-like MFS transporter